MAYKRELQGLGMIIKKINNNPILQGSCTSYDAGIAKAEGGLGDAGYLYNFVAFGFVFLF